jgi:hypothetical protein
VSVTLGSGCQWVLTGDSYITSFTGDVSGIVTTGNRLCDGTAITTNQPRSSKARGNHPRALLLFTDEMWRFCVAHIFVR